jgi:hypothetical protein
MCYLEGVRSLKTEHIHRLVRPKLAQGITLFNTGSISVNTISFAVPATSEFQQQRCIHKPNAVAVRHNMHISRDETKVLVFIGKNTIITMVMIKSHIIEMLNILAT